MAKRTEYKLGGGRGQWHIFTSKDDDDINLHCVIGKKKAKRKQQARYSGTLTIRTGEGSIEIIISDALGDSSKKTLAQYIKERELDTITMEDLVKAVNNDK